VTSAVLKEYPNATLFPGVDSELLKKTKEYILAYLGNRVPLPKIPLDLRRGSRFDRTVWRVIESIAFGESRSYGQVAAEANSTGAARAVGRACGKNPVPILIPCYRIITSEGKLGGYSGGLGIKRDLLELEKSA
jgi:methylated-DNA-[protein]-cysteine S-methyltransferase